MSIQTLTVQAVPGERALASDFNEVVDKVNEIINAISDTSTITGLEQAIADLQTAMEGKVDTTTFTSAVQEIQTALAGKASQTDLDALSTALATLTSSAITDVKVNGTSLTKTNNAVDVPLASSSTDGVMSKEDKADFDSLNIASTITSNGKIYRITEDITLSSNTTYTLASGSILMFEGGKLIGGTSTTLTGTNTAIQAPAYQIFSSITLDGTWSVRECYPEWWGAVGDGSTDDTSALNLAISSPFDRIVLLSKTYVISSGLFLPASKAIEGITVSNRTTTPAIAVSTSVSESSPITHMIRVRSFCSLRNFLLYGRGRAYYGIYGISESSSADGDPHKLNIEGVAMYHLKIGLSLHTFLTRISGCAVTGARIGFQLLGGTSTTMINCYVKGFMMMAYFIKSMTYSTMINCCADTCHAWSDGTRRGSTNPTQTESADTVTDDEKQEILGNYYTLFYGFTYLLNQCRTITMISCACEDVVKGIFLENSHVIRIIGTTMDMQGVTRTSDAGRVLFSQISNHVTIEGMYVTDWAGNGWESQSDKILAFYSGSSKYNVVIRNFQMRSYNSSRVDTTWFLTDSHIRETGNGENTITIEYDRWRKRGVEGAKPNNLGWIVGRGFQYYNLTTKMTEVWNGNRWVQLLGNDGQWCYAITENIIHKSASEIDQSASVAKGDPVSEWVLTNGMLYNAASFDDWDNYSNDIGEQCTFDNYLPPSSTTKMYCLWFRVYEGDIISVSTSRVGNVPQSTPTLLITDASGIITFRKLNTNNIIIGYDENDNPIYDMESEITDSITGYEVQQDGFGFTSVDEDYFSNFWIRIRRVVKTNVIEQRLAALEAAVFN